MTQAGLPSELANSALPSSVPVPASELTPDPASALSAPADTASTSASPHLFEAEVQSLAGAVRYASSPSGSAPDLSVDTNFWDVEMMAPPNATSLSFHSFLPEPSLSPFPPKSPKEAMIPTFNWTKLTRLLPLLPSTKAAIARLRAYTPPSFPLWDQLPATRRAAVLILLYADRRGDLRVVLTMRAASLRSFSGHAAFPGGKADSVDETPYQIARREACEEIGLPMDDSKIPAPFKIEFLCHLPHSLARNGLAVRPCVALLHNPLTPARTNSSTNSKPINSSSAHSHSPPDSMIPRLDAKEVAAVFSASFGNFLRATDAPVPAGSTPLPAGHWYDGNWISWKDEPWRVHNFYVPVNNQRVVKPDNEDVATPVPDPLENGDSTPAQGEKLEEVAERYRVWGMTAKILVEAASLAYARRPEFEHNEVWGDEKIILLANEEGQFFDRGTKIKVTADVAATTTRTNEPLTPTDEAVEAAKRTEPAKM